jgi:hypothetical protein
VTGEERQPFIRSGCKLRCWLCKKQDQEKKAKTFDTNFDMRVCARHLTPKCYEMFLTCLSDAKVIIAQQECEQLLKNVMTKFKAEQISSANNPIREQALI